MKNLDLAISDEGVAILQTAVHERIASLEARKRLPRGVSVRELRNELAELERISSALRRERCRRSHAIGIEIGPRVPAPELEPSFVDGSNV